MEEFSLLFRFISLICNFFQNIMDSEYTHPVTPNIKSRGKYKFLTFEFDSPIKWDITLLLLFWHLVSLWALFVVPFRQHWRLTVYSKYYLNKIINCNFQPSLCQSLGYFQAREENRGITRSQKWVKLARLK